MFLSQIQLNPARRTARPLLSSPHSMHAAVLASFLDPTSRPNGRVLWRLDEKRHKTLLYIVSPERPDLTHLAEQAGWPSLEDAWRVRPYNNILEQVAIGQRYAFRLTANPVRSKRIPEGARGKIHGVSSSAEQEQWLLSRQERLGFRVSEISLPAGIRTDLPPAAPTSPEHAQSITDERTLTFSRRETSVTLRVASYEGLLEVTDRDAFIHALSFGIGRARGYGCGLMTLAPVR